MNIRAHFFKFMSCFDVFLWLHGLHVLAILSQLSWKEKNIIQDLSYTIKFHICRIIRTKMRCTKSSWFWREGNLYKSNKILKIISAICKGWCRHFLGSLKSVVYVYLFIPQQPRHYYLRPKLNGIRYYGETDIFMHKYSGRVWSILLTEQPEVTLKLPHLP